jgi:hypothetical protein
MNDEQHIWEAYEMIKESSDSDKKTISTKYEWALESIDREYEDVLETYRFDSLLEVSEYIKANPLPPDQKYMVGLSRSRGVYIGGDFADDEEDTDIAYVEDGRLPDRFPNAGAVVPKKYKLEFDKYKSHLPNLE